MLEKYPSDNYYAWFDTVTAMIAAEFVYYHIHVDIGEI